MKVLSKDYILSLIAEEEQSLGEMARPPKETTESGWTVKNLDEPVRFEIPGKNIAGKNPETGEVDPDVIYSHRMRTSPNGKEVYEFVNENSPNKQKFKVEVYDPILKKIFPDGRLPRNAYYGTSWVKKELPSEPEQEFDPDDPNYVFPDEDEQRSKIRKVLVGRGLWAKTNVINPILNSFFSDPKIRKKLIVCGIPTISADREHTEPVTNIVPQMNFIGNIPDAEAIRHPKEEEKRMPLSLQFEYHGVRDEDGIQDAIDKIYEKRMMLANGEVPPNDEASDYNRRLYAHLYPRSKWTADQRADSEKHHELTPKYGLHKKGVQWGTKAFNVLSRIQFIGRVVGDEYILDIKFKVDKSMRPVTKSRGEERGDLIDPITTRVVKSIPYQADNDNFTINKKTADFFSEIFKEGLQKIGTEIIQLNPDTVLGNLRVVGADVDPDFDL